MTEAERLAKRLTAGWSLDLAREGAAELRRLEAECERLREHAVTLANTTYLTTLELCAKVCEAHFNHEAKDCAEEIRALANAATPAPAPEAKPEAQPLTAMQARSVVDGMGWALDEVEIEDMEMLVKAAERACAEQWGVKLAGIGASGEVSK